MRNSVLATMIGAIVSLLACGWYYRNGSFDFGMHYALIAYVFDHWSVPSRADHYLEIMQDYPPAAHAGAAVIGTAFGSPVIGMHLLTVLSIFISYAALFWQMRFQTARPTFWAFGMTAAVLVFTCRSPSWLGVEVVGNYFFAHIVGTACVLSFVAVQHRAHAVAAVIGIFLLGWVYPLSAVQLACIATIWIVLQRDAAWKIGVFAICAAAAICFHPSFQASVANASHNGDIGTGFLPKSSVYPATALLTLVSGTLAIEYRCGRLKLISGPAFIATSSGIAAAAIVQMIALHVVGKGSQYLVYKHMFLVTTLLLMTSAVLVVHLFRVEGRAQSKASFAFFAFVALTTILVPFLGRPIRSAAALEKAIRTDPDAATSAIATDRHAFRAGILHIPLHEAFATR